MDCEISQDIQTQVLLFFGSDKMSSLKDLFLEKSSSVFTENKILKFCFVCMAVFSFFQWQAVNNLIASAKTIIVPTGSSYKMAIRNSSASSEYLQSMGRYITDLYGDVSVANVDYKYSELLKLSSSISFHKLKKDLSKRSLLIKRYPAISYSMEIDENAKSIFTENNLLLPVKKKRIVGDTMEKEQNIKLSIDYKINSGRFELISIKEIER